MDSQKTQNYQSNPEEKDQNWRLNPPRLQAILQSDNVQNNNGIGTKIDI